MVNYARCWGKVYQPKHKIFLDHEKASDLLHLTVKYLPYVLHLKNQYCSSQPPYNAHFIFPYKPYFTLVVSGIQKKALNNWKLGQ